ncbi:unnamed protein product [Thelazia callipaeda]|uniref:S1 motif domain-containing protein n=1 Tax=Thelazia callipaeda TaxID=103827 RepID=A0A0N5D8A5_THECL|nr:unnamed protein product [Thelazia callipaeda]
MVKVTKLIGQIRNEGVEMIARGVTIYVDERMRYAIMHASHFGPVLISRHFKQETVKLGQWLSVAVEPNRDYLLTSERTKCQFADAVEPEIIEELLPTGTSLTRLGVLTTRIQTPVFVGNASFASCIGLSPLLGRVFLKESLCKKINLNPLTWVRCDVSPVEPSHSNFNTFWEARTIGFQDSTDPSLNQSVKRYTGRFIGFSERNVCILQLFHKRRNAGFALVNSYDFAHTVDEHNLKKAEAIQVYAASQHPVYPELCVPACYARIVNYGSNKASVETADEMFASLVFNETSIRYGSTAGDVVVAPDSKISNIYKQSAQLGEEIEFVDNFEGIRNLRFQRTLKSVSPVVIHRLGFKDVVHILSVMADEYSAQLKKAFRDLQTKMVDTNRRLQLGESLKKQQEQRRRISQLTKSHLLELDKETPVYMSVGRIFAKGSVDSEIARHEEEISKANERIISIDHQKKYLEKSLAESEKNIRELVQSRP